MQMKRVRVDVITGITVVLGVLVTVGIIWGVTEYRQSTKPFTSSRYIFTCDVDNIAVKDGSGRLTCTPTEEYGIRRPMTIDVHDDVQLHRLEHLRRGDSIACNVEYRIPASAPVDVSMEELRSPYILLRNHPELDKYLKMATLCDGLPCIIEQR